MLSVRPVSGLFTSAWIAEAIALGEHFICCIESFGYKNGQPSGRPFFWGLSLVLSSDAVSCRSWLASDGR
jgi:hypothetical protein